MGTIALLFTDIEGSTRLASELGAAWPAVLADHHALVGGAIAEAGGFVDGTEGDAFFATFADAQAGARAAVAALRHLRSHEWPSAAGELKVRMGLHVGYVERNETGYVGLEVHRAARVAAAAHGGQLLLTGAARALVGDEVVLEPLGAHRLKDFPAPELLFCAVVDGRGAAFFPPPRTQQIRPTNLPAGLPALVGREAELERIRDAFLVDGERIVTLTGRGGVGKTSLALAAATSLLDEHPGGVWLARLATATSPDQVLPLVASILRADGDGDGSPMQAIVSRVSGRGRTLIMLDNLEHLVAASPVLSDLLDASPELRLLVTSQAPLRIVRERCVAVDALDEAAALELISRVARRRSASFAVTHDDRVVLGEIASMLDGLPLALELAAARLTFLRPEQLRDRLHGSSDVLRDDMRDRSDRHRSLRATVEWTLGLLEEPARALFVRMGAFAALVELEELEAVAATDGLDVVAALSGLLDVALARRVESGDGRIRFDLPEALRQIAAAMLDSASDGERWHRAHAGRQLELQWAARDLDSPRAVHEAAIAADTEADRALQWARAVDDPVAVPLAAARATLLAYSGHVREALALIEPVLQSPPANTDVHGQAQLAYSVALERQGRQADADAAANAAVALASTERSRASALISRGIHHLQARRLEAALADHQQATTIARRLGPEALYKALTRESQARVEAGQLAVAADLLDEADELGVDTSHLGSRHTLDGDMALLLERPRDAIEHYAVSLELAQAHHDDGQVHMDLVGLADALAMDHDDIEALEVSGIAEAQNHDLGATTVWHVQGRDLVLEAEQRVDPGAASKARERGRTVDPGYRVTRACELGRRPIQ